MSEIRNSIRFAEIERLLDDYFAFHIQPVMRGTQEEVMRKQAEERANFSNSKGYLLGGVASASAAYGVDPYTPINITGEWTNKTAEDYLAMCGERISSSKDISQDLATIANEWRTAVIGEIGRDRYDELSAQLGEDLAYAYVGHRIEQLIVDRLVKEDMPHSTADYIMRKAAETSLFSLSNVVNKSPLQTEIDERIEKAYNPSNKEKVSGWIAGSVADSLTMGVVSWGQLAKFVGIDVTLNAGIEKYQEKTSENTLSVEECISRGVFGSETNVFSGFRKDAKAIDKEQDDYIKETYSHLNRKIPVESLKLYSYEPQSWEPGFKTATQNEPDYNDVPMAIAPEQVESYRAEKEKEELRQAKKSTETNGYEPLSVQNNEVNNTRQMDTLQTDAQATQNTTTQNATTNESGWGGFLSNFGLDGIGDVCKNLGYVLAMLPDMLVGLFTGKTKSLDMKSSMMPLLSIVAGIFIKNPILKMLLIGMGGANLLNKVGHEAMERQMPSNATQSISPGRYKKYDDEPLNPRITNPVLQGSNLVADIDRVPCTIQLSQTVVDAYRAGALPLNTLANAVLERSDAMREAATRNYEESERQTVVRTRGIQ